MGAELEQPFGTDANDFPLLKMGDGLCDDLDALLRTANKERVSARHELPSVTRAATIRLAKPDPSKTGQQLEASDVASAASEPSDANDAVSTGEVTSKTRTMSYSENI